jgi:hypothetical protein
LADRASPKVNSTAFDHTCVLKLIESVFNVSPLAAREIELIDSGMAHGWTAY